VEGFVYPGASGLLYFYAPPVYFPAVIGGLAVWRHNKPILFVKKTKKCVQGPLHECTSGRAFPGYPLTAHDSYVFSMALGG